ncbi:MAG: PLP-dependent aminotransferase family protein [Rhodospirillaceae bacterium]|nr:PLP-dependent aminotransferase family protein [Rhodospirillales bacterium]
MTAPLQISVDRAVTVPLTTQIHGAIRDAIRDGRLTGGARLPSWRDLAAQLGVARGTVRAAYERLIDEQLIVGMGAAGTRVAAQAVAAAPDAGTSDTPPFAELFHKFDSAPMPFQMGVPAQDAFPITLWSRIMVRAARASAMVPVGYPDPRGLPELRHEIAAYLAIARGIRCTPAQILITGGFSGALGLALRTLRLEGGTAWMEDPGFPLTRTALHLAGMKVAAVPVDAEGADVSQAPVAALAVVTPGQQAPLGVTMSLARRLALLDWAKTSNAWIIEDDYLSELQLKGRAAPALAALDREGRVLHAGTFAKTISPTLRLGFLVVPPQLASQFGTAAACLAPAPNSVVQRAVAEFMTAGHYLRHLRRMKRLYAARRDALVNHMGETATAGLAVRLTLPHGANDVDIATRALALGLSPVPLSPWYAGQPQSHGLLLGVTNMVERRIASDCVKLLGLIEGAVPG